MKRALACLSFVLLCQAAVAAQRARVARLKRGPSFVAARYLAGLESVPDNAGVMATGDLDNDGDVDLVGCERPSLSSAPTAILTWLNDENGEFHLAHRLEFVPWTFSAAFDIARQVFLADMNGDGVLDLAYDRRITAGSMPSGVLAHPGLGDGSFGARVILESNGPLQGFLVGDCDGDGDADLLLYESNSGTDYRPTLAWWRFEGGTFVAGPSLDVDAERPMRLSATDVDGDGITDAVAGTFNGRDEVLIFLTVAGAPTLLTTVPLPSDLHDVNQHYQTGDVDGDGDEDVLVVLEGFAQGLFYVQPILRMPTAYEVAPLQVFANPSNDHFLSRDGVLGDWDGDGDLDFVSPTFHWLENVGGASFAAAGKQLSSWSGNGSRTPMHVVDADGDGHLDALAHRQMVLGTGSIPRSSSAPSTSMTFGGWTRAEDWDGDGDLDLTSAGQLLMNNGDGSFVTRPTPFFVGAFQEDLVAWGDFDGNGLRDVLVAPFDYPFEFLGMRLFSGREDGTYATSPIVPSPVPMPAGASSGDLDGDGDVDVLATDGYWTNDGSGRFGSAPVAAYVGAPRLVLDVDGDLDVDLLVLRSGRLELLRNLGGLGFTTTDLGAHGGGALPAFLDADQDGDLDFVVAEPANGLVAVHEQLPGGGFAAPLFLSAPGVNGPVGAVDVDNDGRLDLVAPRSVTAGIGSIQLLTAWFRGAALDYGAPRAWVSSEAPRAYGDVDGDGDTEALGGRLFDNLSFDGARSGFAVQYGLGAATSGTDGRRPLLGAHGPKRCDRPVELVIARGRGGASGVLLMGTARADVLDGAFRRLVADPRVVRSFVLGGTPGAAGAGALGVRLPRDASLFGRTLDFQAVLVDPGASGGLSATNGLEVRFGEWRLP